MVSGEALICILVWWFFKPWGNQAGAGTEGSSRPVSASCPYRSDPKVLLTSAPGDTCLAQAVHDSFLEMK